MNWGRSGAVAAPGDAIIADLKTADLCSPTRREPGPVVIESNISVSDLRQPSDHRIRDEALIVTTFLLIVASVAVVLLLLRLTPLLPRTYVGRRWLVKRLHETRVTYPLPQACLEEVVSDAYNTAKIVAKAPDAEAGFNEIFMRRLNEAARFFQVRRSARLAAIAACTAVAAACGSEGPEPASQTGTPYTVRCTAQPLPEFTLGSQSNPSSDQEAALCACVWERLGQWEKAVAAKLSEGASGDIDSIQLRAFPSRFGKALEHCGGMDL